MSIGIASIKLCTVRWVAVNVMGGLGYGRVDDAIWLAYSSFSEVYMLGGDALVFTQQAKEDVLGADDPTT